MPTGYTAGVLDGELSTLKDFMCQCARAFGACVHQRDESLSTGIKLREQETYSKRRLQELEKEHQEFLALSDSDIQMRIDQEHQESLEYQRKSLEKFLVEKKRTEDMLLKVQQWVPPTEDHQGLKKFAIEQLESTLSFDFSDWSEKERQKLPIKPSLEEYKKSEEAQYLSDFEYYSEQVQKDEERVNNANQWLIDLINSFE
jgi:hypothetical protein